MMIRAYTRAMPVSRLRATAMGLAIRFAPLGSTPLKARS